MSTLIEPALLAIVAPIVTITALIIALLAIHNTRQSADRVMLVNDIYTLLHTDMIHISKSLTNYRGVLTGSTLWHTLSESGRRYKIPPHLRRSVDNFYRSLVEYRRLRAVAIRVIETNTRQEITKLREGAPAPDEPSKYEQSVYEPEKILAQHEPVAFKLNPTANAVVFSTSSSSADIGLMRSELATIDLTALIQRLHDRANENPDIQRVRILNHQLQESLPKLLDKIRNRISNPTPLFDPIIGLIRRG